MKRKDKKDLLDKFLTDEQDDEKKFSTTEKKNSKKNIEQIKNKSGLSRIKILIISIVVVIFLFVNVIGLFVIYNTVPSSNENVNLTEEEILKLNEENEKTKSELIDKLINEIGYSKEEVEEMISEFDSTENLNAIRFLKNKYDNEKEKLNSEIKVLNDECEVLKINCETDGSLLQQKDIISAKIKTEKERLEKIAREEVKKKEEEQQQSSTSNSNSSSNESANNNNNETDSDSNSTKQCYKSYDEAYQVALDKFLNNDKIEKISVDVNNCPHYFDSNGNEI